MALLVAILVTIPCNGLPIEEWIDNQLKDKQTMGGGAIAGYYKKENMIHSLSPFTGSNSTGIYVDVTTESTTQMKGNDFPTPRDRFKQPVPNAFTTINEHIFFIANNGGNSKSETYLNAYSMKKKGWDDSYWKPLHNRIYTILPCLTSTLNGHYLIMMGGKLQSGNVSNEVIFIDTQNPCKWHYGPPMNASSYNFGCIVAETDGYLYTFGGANSNAVQGWKLNITNGNVPFKDQKWEKVNVDLSYLPQNPTILESIEDKLLYIIGGKSGSDCTKKVTYVNISDAAPHKSTYVPPQLVDAYCYGAGVAVNNRLYLFGGTIIENVTVTQASKWQETIHNTSSPTSSPTNRPTVTTGSPTFDPTNNPSVSPTSRPTTNPTTRPTVSPSNDPTARPTESPTTDPTNKPTAGPTADPTDKPSDSPTIDPTDNPTDSPTKRPSASPTDKPTTDPTVDPTRSPTIDPTDKPSDSPTDDPTTKPTISPTADPTVKPTVSPTVKPTISPSVDPTISPTADPTTKPTISPTVDPTVSPTTDPTAKPTVSPTADPTKLPTADPTTKPTDSPTKDPTNKPTMDPTTKPTDDPTNLPTKEPTPSPTDKPSINPSKTPTNEPTTDPTTDRPTDAPTITPPKSSAPKAKTNWIIIAILIGVAVLLTVTATYCVVKKCKERQVNDRPLLYKNYKL